MFVPLLDDAPLRRIGRPWVTYGFMAACALVYAVFQSGWLIPAHPGAVVSFGLIPSVLFSEAVLPDGYAIIPPWATLVTSLFLHGGLLHLVGNLLFLRAFGDNVEEDLGHLRYALFLLLCGVGAGLAHSWGAANSDAPLVGASGCVAGVVAAYVMLHPQLKVWVLVFYVLSLRLRAFWIIGAWVVFQAGNALLSGQEQIAWWAHVGGFLTGAVLVVALKRPEVRLFDHELRARIRRRAEDPIGDSA
ncbi:MAG TPA: rhomboid family intramembrane serine protease [Hansschlegelia sp.]